MFTSTAAQALSDYWLRIAIEGNFALDQISIVPDHMHLIVRIVPKTSTEEIALLLLNNGQDFISTNYPELLIECGLTQLWSNSAYAGTCGQTTTALLMKWLGSNE